MESNQTLFQRKNWKLFKEGDYIIRTINHMYIHPENYVKKIKIMDMKNLRYYWEDGGRQSGYIYFREANEFELANTKLRTLHKLMVE